MLIAKKEGVGGSRGDVFRCCNFLLIMLIIIWGLCTMPFLLIFIHHPLLGFRGMHHQLLPCNKFNYLTTKIAGRGEWEKERERDVACWYTLLFGRQTIIHISCSRVSLAICQGQVSGWQPSKASPLPLCLTLSVAFIFMYITLTQGS